MKEQEKNSLCPNCGADLNKEGVGYDNHCYQVTYPDGSCGDLEIGDVIEYYCPLCGERLPEKLAWEIVDEWNGEE